MAYLHKARRLGSERDRISGAEVLGITPPIDGVIAEVVLTERGHTNHASVDRMQEVDSDGRDIRLCNHRRDSSVGRATD